MLKSIIKDAIELLIKKPKVIQAAFLMTCGHTIVYIFFITYFFNSVIKMKYNSGIDASTALIYLFNKIQEFNITGVIMSFVLAAVIGYFYVYPVGEATLIYAVQQEGNNISKSFNQGIKKFFKMLEYRSLSTFLGIYTIITVIIRLRVMGILDSIIIKPIITIRMLSAFFTIIFWPYLKFYVVLKEIPVFDAMKKSVLLTLGNFRLTLKALIVEMIGMMRLVIIAVLSAMVPLGLMYLAINTGMMEYRGIEIFLRTITGAILLAIVYLNSIFEAFLISFWQKVFEKAEKNLE